MPSTPHHRHTFPPTAALALSEIPDGATNHDVANPELAAWVARTAVLARPDEVVWVDGSPEQWSVIVTAATLRTDTVRLDPGARPGSVLTRSHGARTGERVLTADRSLRRAALDDVAESMRGRTMYVVPFAVGGLDAPTLVGAHVTDSAASVAVLRTLAHVGNDVLDAIGPDTPFVRTVHATLRRTRDSRGARLLDDLVPAERDRRVVHDDRTTTAWVLGSDDATAVLRSLEAHLGSAGQAELTVVGIRRSDTHPGTAVALTVPAALVPGRTPSGRTVELLRTGALTGTVVPLAGLDPSSALADDAQHDAVFTDAALTEDGDAWWPGSRDAAAGHLITSEGRYVSAADATRDADPDATVAVRFHAGSADAGRVASRVDAVFVTSPEGAAAADALAAAAEVLGEQAPWVCAAWASADALGTLLDELVDGLVDAPHAATVAA